MKRHQRLANTFVVKVTTIFLLSQMACAIVLLNFFNSTSYAQDRAKAVSFYTESVKASQEANVDKAIEIVKEAIKADSTYPEAYDHLGYLLLKKSQYDEAINAFNTALKINPRMQTSKTGIGFALIQKGDLKGAEPVLTDALKLNPYPSMTHYALGLLYEKLGDYQKAIMHYKEGIKQHRVRVGKE